jgi:hypothetical protein
LLLPACLYFHTQGNPQYVCMLHGQYSTTMLLSMLLGSPRRSCCSDESIERDHSVKSMHTLSLCFWCSELSISIPCRFEKQLNCWLKGSPKEKPNISACAEESNFTCARLVPPGLENEVAHPLCGPFCRSSTFSSTVVSQGLSLECRHFSSL